MGLFLATRPAGLFVPAILACAAVTEPLTAAAAVVFLPASGSQRSDYAWLAAGALAFDAVAR
jgi:hypothetical protein